MARCCPVPGCQVLRITSAPLCTRHWESVSEVARKVYVKAEKRAATAQGDAAGVIANHERDCALDLIVAEASKPKNKNMGRTGSTYPAGPSLV